MTAVAEILIYNNLPDGGGVYDCVKNNFEHCFQVNEVESLCKVFQQGKTRLVLFHCQDISESLIAYGELLNSSPKSLITKHKSILLVDQSEEGNGFEVYAEGLFNDYLVASPEFNSQRLLSIIMHEFIELGEFSHRCPMNDNELGSDIKTCIESSMKKKKEVMDTFENLVSSMEMEVIEGIKRLQKGDFHKLNDVVNVDKITQILTQFKSAELRPSLLSLELKLMKFLSMAVESLGRQAIATDSSQVKAVSKSGNNAKPTEINQEPEQSETNVPAKPSLGSTKCYRKKKILLVDDCPAHHQLIRDIGKGAMQNIVVVTNGRSAMQKIERNEFDLLLMNVNLSDSDGVRLVDSIKRSTPEAENYKFVMLCSARNKDAITRCAQMGGISGIVPTPLEKSAIITAYRRAFVDEDVNETE